MAFAVPTGYIDSTIRIIIIGFGFDYEERAERVRVDKQEIGECISPLSRFPLASEDIS